MPGKNCATCEHASKKPEELPCRQCTETTVPDNYFPLWEAKKK